MKTQLLLLSLAWIAAARAAESDQDFIAHEWGTFTSVQASDGNQLDWNPLIAPELPKFVYSGGQFLPENSSFAALSNGYKGQFVCRERMETPVIYFYNRRVLPQTVDVTVRFPQGTITEWYPQKSAADVREPGARRANGKIAPVLLWSHVDIMPSFLCSILLPQDNSGSNYYSARETDASQLIVGEQPKEIEKFLFYRGVGDFISPLRVGLAEDDSTRVSLLNLGQEDIPSLFLCEKRADGTFRWQPIEKLNVREPRDISLANATGIDEESLATALRAELVREGLYEKEAAAMVKTWRSAWLGEQGMRVIYTLPRAWTDRTLPLDISPAPQAIQRVMVGRAEIITPAMEDALLAIALCYNDAKPGDRIVLTTQARALGLGRFAEPTLRRLLYTHRIPYRAFAPCMEMVKATILPPPFAAR
jgi:hypothetical protein